MSVDEERAVALFGGSTADVRNALNAQTGAWLFNRYRQATTYGGSNTLPFATRCSPRCRGSELMVIYLTGTPVEKLFGEVSCGDVGGKV